MGKKTEALLQILSGHTYDTLLNGHRAKINKAVSELCETCKVIEDIDHYLLHCQKYKKERDQLEIRVEEILNGAGLNEVADIMSGYGGDVHRETLNELTRALML